MGPMPQLDMLLELLGRLGIPVRREPLGGGGGGLCTVRGQRVLFVDTSADEVTQTECCMRALALVPEADVIYLPPALREAIERIKQDMQA
jgi:hypothetical protein